mgnify:CR=1 FL=1
MRIRRKLAVIKITVAARERRRLQGRRRHILFKYGPALLPLVVSGRKRKSSKWHCRTAEMVHAFRGLMFYEWHILNNKGLLIREIFT